MSMTHYEMQEEAERLARLYLHQRPQFRTVLLRRLEQENPQLFIMVVRLMAPALLRERMQGRAEAERHYLIRRDLIIKLLTLGCLGAIVVLMLLQIWM